jgi:ATP-dependent Lhr-like helicase
LAEARREIEKWFADKGWSPFRFQRQVWNAYLAGESGLIHATTGNGKTYAAWLGPVIEALAERAAADDRAAGNGNAATEKTRAKSAKKKRIAPPLRVLWITPLRALAGDTFEALARPLVDFGLDWQLETRTGDTKASVRNRQRTRLPTALVTTPESLSLFLTRDDAREQFRDLRLVIVDEWHELLSTKRGVQVELALARLRRWSPGLRTWGLSATLGNLETALSVLLGTEPAMPGRLITGGPQKTYKIESLIPATIERFPWAGHMGLKLLPEVVAAVDSARSCLLFTNTRFQAEQWYQAVLRARPDWAGLLALHHGSLDHGVRHWVEDRLREGKLRCVVCTSSLDLGVDFTPVDRVLQVGSPKGAARLLQRAGRSGHQPGAASRIACVPTHAFELIENAGARDIVAAGNLEGRPPLELPLDTLVQHAVTIAAGGGFRSDDLYDEVRTTYAFRDLSRDDWLWVLDFVTRGGTALRAYPDYHRVKLDADGVYRVADARIARMHRMTVGTITGDSALQVRFLKGGRLGTIEEQFVARLRPGDVFTFAGKRLKFVRLHDMTVWVRSANAEKGEIPRWLGGRLPLSTELADAVRGRLDAARRGLFDGPEMKAVEPILALQARWSQIPALGEFLVERLHSRDGHHLFLFPFAGRLVHEGLAALWAYRLSRRRPITFGMTVNDYGIELLSPDDPLPEGVLPADFFATDRLLDDILDSLNSVEMARRHFREIARVSGLISAGFPGAPKSTKQLQASAGLLFDVFREYDPDNRLLGQARREVLERQLEHRRLRATLLRLSVAQVVTASPPRATPLAFPLLVDRLRERLSTETLGDRVRKMQLSLENAAGI